MHSVLFVVLLDLVDLPLVGVGACAALQSLWVFGEILLHQGQGLGAVRDFVLVFFLHFSKSVYMVPYVYILMCTNSKLVFIRKRRGSAVSLYRIPAEVLYVVYEFNCIQHSTYIASH